MRLLRVLVVVILLGGYGLSALYSIVNKSPTFDEGIHLTAGYSYWDLNDYRLQPENGNLPQRWGAIPLLVQPLNEFDRDHSYWKTGNVWEIERIFLFSIGNDAYWIFFTARSMMVLAAMLIGLLVFFFSRRLWGYGGGILTLALYCFSPDYLAHGRLITSDVIGSGAFIAALWALTCLLRRISWLSVVITGLTFGILAVSKYYAVLMVPIVGILVIAHLLLTKQTILAFRGQRILHGISARLGALVAGFVFVGLIAWVVLWAFYGFRYAAFNDELHHGRFFESWEAISPDSGLIAGSIDIAREYHLLPESYLYGFSHVLKHSEFRHAYMAGEFSSTGWWYYFGFTFLAKSPAAFLALLVLWFSLLLLRKKVTAQNSEKGMPYWLPLVVLIFVYGIAALTTSLNIGHRHIMPIYISLFVLMGGMWRICVIHGQATVGLLLALVGLYVAESVTVYPHYLTFFNRLAGGPENGYQLLGDSSLDWGQDLYLADDWLKEKNPGPNAQAVTLAYFGRSSPTYLGMDVRYWQSRGMFKGERFTISPFEPGLFVTSASMLQGLYGPVHDPWTQTEESNYLFLINEMERLIAASTDLKSSIEFVKREGGGKAWYSKMQHFIDYRSWRLRHFLGDHEPIAVLGNTIFIYELTKEDAKEMLIRPEVGFPDDFPTRRLHDQCRHLSLNNQNETTAAN